MDLLIMMILGPCRPSRSAESGLSPRRALCSLTPLTHVRKADDARTDEWNRSLPHGHSLRQRGGD